MPQKKSAAPASPTPSQKKKPPLPARPVRGGRGRKKVELALSENGQHFRILIEKAPVAILVSRNGIILYSNQKLQELFGFSGYKELAGQPVVRYIAPQSRKASLERSRRRADGLPVPTEFEAFALHPDGSQFPIQVTVGTVQLSDGPANLAFITDITGRRQAEAALRLSEDRYRDLVENSLDIICTHDFAGRVLSVNPAAARLLGYDQDELIGMDLRDIIAPEALKFFDPYLRRLKRKGSASGLLEVQTRNGERRVWEYRNTVRAEALAQPVVRGMARDVTERRQAEIALRESESRYQLVFENSGTSNTIFDMDCRVILQNTLSKNYYQSMVPSGDAHGKTALEVFGPEQGPLVNERMQRVLNSDVAEVFETEFITPSGGKWMSSSYLPVRDQQKRIIGIQVISQDISDRKHAEQALLQKMDELQRFQRLTVGRELQMIEMKKEINALLAQAGLPAKYPLPSEKKPDEPLSH